MDVLTGILLINLGTPLSPKSKDVSRYLTEFLTDSRVIDISWLKRQLLVRGVIVPQRLKNSAKCYEQIWSPEGSPLLVYGRKIKMLLQEKMGPKFVVELAMRYQKPSIEKALTSLFTADIEELVILPLFPQYASATTGSIQQKVMEELSRRLYIPKVTFINNFATHQSFIEAFCSRGREYDLDSYDHILFSYHGLPQRHVRKINKSNYCLKNSSCCYSLCEANRSCYAAQCYATTQSIVQRLNIDLNRSSISFQSRLGKEPWLQPFTIDKIKELAQQNCKRVLVFCPSFVCDCLETIYEIGIEYAAEFRENGGECLDLVRGLNEHPKWIEALEKIALNLKK
jgi:protoporphyrin/coproporphyrin ferrochelatase